MLRISPREWEPEAEGQSFTLVHSFWYITGALTLQGNAAPPQKYYNLKNVKMKTTPALLSYMIQRQGCS